MDISRDEARRLRRDLDKANDRALRAHETVLTAMFEDELTTPAERTQVLLGGLARRRFLTIGAFSVATAAVLAACGAGEEEGSVPQEGEAPSTSALPTRTHTDTILLRTVASLERNAIAAYDAAAPLLSGQAKDIAAAFKAHHVAHAEAMDDQTRRLGGEPFTQPNPAVATKVLTPALTLVKTQSDALHLAHALENVAAHTYQQFVPLLTVPALRSAMMTIGSVEARHAAVLALALGGSAAPALATIPAAGGTTTAAGAVAATTTAAASTGVEAPAIYVVPGAFEPLSASQLLLGGELLAIAPLGPNSYTY